ncbi:hypothetical protein D3C73_1431230 [compost metagenome]
MSTIQQQVCYVMVNFHADHLPWSISTEHKKRIMHTLCPGKFIMLPVFIHQIEELFTIFVSLLCKDVYQSVDFHILATAHIQPYANIRMLRLFVHFL